MTSTPQPRREALGDGCVESYCATLSSAPASLPGAAHCFPCPLSDTKGGKKKIEKKRKKKKDDEGEDCQFWISFISLDTASAGRNPGGRRRRCR